MRMFTFFLSICFFLFINNQSFCFEPAEKKLLPCDGANGDSFGNSVSISGDTVVAGARWDDENSLFSGSAYIFIRDVDSWIQQAKLLASDGQESDNFGYSVSISGNYAVIGAYNDDDSGNASGSAYVFKRDGDSWAQQDKLLAGDGDETDNFGHSVAIYDDTIVIGAIGDQNNGNYSGSAYVFKRNGNSWIQKIKLLASDGAENDYFGYSVDIPGDFTVLGARGDDDNGTDSGSAYIKEMGGTAMPWIPELLLDE